ncbi:hypothetical protein Tco_0320100 [Tanacetum coccineum]
MANQEQNPPQQEQPFVAAKQVGFNLKDIILNTNNEVALLYPEHNNKDYFKCVSNFISKCCLRKPFTRSPNMYKEYLAEFWYSAKALKNSKVSFPIPTGVFSKLIGYGEEVMSKKNSTERVHSFLVVFKASKTSSKAESVSQGTKPGAQTGHKKPLTSSKQPFVSSKEATKGGSSKAFTGSKIGHSKTREKSSNSAMDSNPSQPPRCDASADSTAEVDLGLSAPNDSYLPQIEKYG